MLDWRGTGMSVMEMSHRGKEFMGIAAKAEADLRTLLAIPDDYSVLFLQGGAIAENAIVPMNLLGGRTVADYVNTGEWSKKSIKEAKKYCTVNIAASSEDANFTYVPRAARGSSTATPRTCTSAPTKRSAASNTNGRRRPATCRWWRTCRRTSCPASSTSSKYGVIYGGAQKNVGPGGPDAA